MTPKWPQLTSSNMKQNFLTKANFGAYNMSFNESITHFESFHKFFWDAESSVLSYLNFESLNDLQMA